MNIFHNQYDYASNAIRYFEKNKIKHKYNVIGNVLLFSFLKKILEKTNLNLQDNISESVLFSIIKNKRLDNIFDYIKNKNINPY